MASITELVENEIRRFPDNVGHVLGSRSLRRQNTLAGRLTYWAWKSRDIANDGSLFAKRYSAARKNPAPDPSCTVRQQHLLSPPTLMARRKLDAKSGGTLLMGQAFLFIKRPLTTPSFYDIGRAEPPRARAPIPKFAS